MRYWLYGTHAVLAALTNPHRVCLRLALCAKDKPDIAARAAKRSIPVQILEAGAFQRLLPPGSIHQNIALQVESLPSPTLEDLAGHETATLVVLDQVTDPHNVGAILRSAAAFGAAAVIAQSRNAPEESGLLGKTASGALEHLSYIQVVNISRTLEELKTLGFWCFGLDSAPHYPDITTLPYYPKKALVLGAEGSGLRPLVQKQCDDCLRLPTVPHFPSLNVSNAAAIALFSLRA